MTVLSLFDGISCGMAALERAEIPVDNYIAYEIDKFAIQTSAKNYPEIVRRGDVFDGNFSDFRGVDLLLGGRQKLIPAVLKPFITYKMLDALVQTVFDGIERYAKKQVEKKSEKKDADS